MDVAFVSQFRDGKQIYLATAGDPESFGIEIHDGPSLDATFCQKLVRNAIPPVIPDTASNPEVADLSVTHEKGIGAYVGVPLRFADGEVYGTFCCLSHNPDSALNDRDARFMAMLAEILASRLQEGEHHRRQRARMLEIIETQDFAVALQPVVSLPTGGLVGVEALARFTPDLGAPDVVFAQARELGVGALLEASAFRQSHSVASQLPPNTYLAINLSPAVLNHRAVVAALDAVDDPSGYVLELTEHVSVDEYEPLTTALAPLRSRGFRLAVDDVGAGYASFHHVLELSPDIIKIDRSLVSGASHDGARRRIITSIVLLGMDLGSTVVAEGVETHDDLQAVAELGVDAAQGYLLAHPTVHRGAIREWTEGWHLEADTPGSRLADRREALGTVLRNLRGSRRQVDVLREVNEQLQATGESARVSQGQYSAYEHGRERPMAVRLRAIEAVFDLEPGALTAMLDGVPPGSATGRAPDVMSLAARLGEGRRAGSSP